MEAIRKFFLHEISVQAVKLKWHCLSTNTSSISELFPSEISDYGDS